MVFQKILIFVLNINFFGVFSQYAPPPHANPNVSGNGYHMGHGYNTGVFGGWGNSSWTNSIMENIRNFLTFKFITDFFNNDKNLKECETGKYLDDTKCTACTTCGDNEVETTACTPNTNRVCSACSTGFYENNGTCTECADCTSDNKKDNEPCDSTCGACKDDFNAVGELCEACEGTLNQASCLSTECSLNHFWKANIPQCVACSELSDTKNTDQDDCRQIVYCPNYYWDDSNNGPCLACSGALQVGCGDPDNNDTNKCPNHYWNVDSCDACASDCATQNKEDNEPCDGTCGACKDDFFADGELCKDCEGTLNQDACESTECSPNHVWKNGSCVGRFSGPP